MGVIVCLVQPLVVPPPSWWPFRHARQGLAGTVHFDVMRELLATTEAKVLLAIDEYNELFQSSHWHYGEEKVRIYIKKAAVVKGGVPHGAWLARFPVSERLFKEPRGNMKRALGQVRRTVWHTQRTLYAQAEQYSWALDALIPGDTGGAQDTKPEAVVTKTSGAVVKSRCSVRRNPLLR